MILHSGSRAQDTGLICRVTYHIRVISVSFGGKCGLLCMHRKCLYDSGCVNFSRSQSGDLQRNKVRKPELDAACVAQFLSLAGAQNLAALNL